MDFISPITIFFIVFIIGYYFGKLKLFGISFGLAGVLIVAVMAGWLMTVTPFIGKALIVSEYKPSMNFYSSFGTALFVSVIGINTGYTLNIKKLNDFKAVIIGSLMVISAFLTMKLIAIIDTTISFSTLVGTLCGALTTTPGLSVACELKNIVTEEAIIGYGCSYIFGVILTVLYVQISTRKDSVSAQVKDSVNKDEAPAFSLMALVQIGITVLMGYIFGDINFSSFSLGNTGGILFAAIGVGIVIKKLFSKNMMYQKSLELFRNLGLVLFFVGNGINSGMQIGCGINMRVILYSVIMAVISILSGLLFNKILFTNNSPAPIIAGGMTSTPAICAIMQKNNNISIDRYPLSYIGALVTIILLFRNF